MFVLPAVAGVVVPVVSAVEQQASVAALRPQLSHSAPWGTVAATTSPRLLEARVVCRASDSRRAPTEAADEQTLPEGGAAATTTVAVEAQATTRPYWV
jgi:hypothetical protein